MQNVIKKPGIYLMLLVLGLMAFQVIRPYFALFMLGLVTVIVFDPMYQWFLKKFKGREGVASLVSTLALLLAIILPAFFLLSIAVSQMLGLLSEWQSTISPETLNDQAWYIWLNSTYTQFQNMSLSEFFAKHESLAEVLKASVSGLAKFMSASIVPLISYSVISITNFFMYMMVVIYLFPMKDDLFAYIVDLTPLSEAQSQKLMTRFKAVTIATIKGTVVIAFACAVAGAMIMIPIGLKAWAVLSILMFLASFIPMGSGIITYPVAIFLIITGHYWQGLTMLIYGLVVMNNIDNVLRPKLMDKGEAALPEIVTLLSAVGGIVVFGFFGFIYGPVIWALFLTALDFYQEMKESKQLV